MSRFNTPSVGTTKTTNLAGGEAYTQSPELELISLLLTSFANDKFYEKADQMFERIRTLIPGCDKKFVAQAAVYARTVFGMRSITHVTASELAKYARGQEWAAGFYNQIVYRPDDMLEIAAYYFRHNAEISMSKRTTKTLPNAMKKGFSAALLRFNEYQLAKYQGSNKAVKLVDMVNLVHPKGSELIQKIVKTGLTSTQTWEAKLSAAGQNANSEDEKAEFKKDVWVEMITQKTIGYFALLRNLRNIMDQAPEVLPQTLASLTNPDFIKKSMVLPFRFITACDEIMNYPNGMRARPVMEALNTAITISLSNVPRFEGDTLIVLDTSSSMTQQVNDKMKKTPAQIGALFAAVLAKANNADLMTFDTCARYVNMNYNDTLITLANSFKFPGGGTNFHSIFQTANRPYARIIILSDMQGWIAHSSPGSPAADFNRWKTAMNCNPFVYSFDLQGYGSMQFPENRVMTVAGFSEKIFDVMKVMETDRNALINEIKKIQL